MKVGILALCTAGLLQLVILHGVTQDQERLTEERRLLNGDRLKLEARLLLAEQRAEARGAGLRQLEARVRKLEQIQSSLSAEASTP